MALRNPNSPSYDPYPAIVSLLEALPAKIAESMLRALPAAAPSLLQPPGKAAGAGAGARPPAPWSDAAGDAPAGDDLLSALSGVARAAGGPLGDLAAAFDRGRRLVDAALRVHRMTAAPQLDVLEEAPDLSPLPVAESAELPIPFAPEQAAAMEAPLPLASDAAQPPIPLAEERALPPLPPAGFPPAAAELPPAAAGAMSPEEAAAALGRTPTGAYEVPIDRPLDAPSPAAEFRGSGHENPDALAAGGDDGGGDDLLALADTVGDLTGEMRDLTGAMKNLADGLAGAGKAPAGEGDEPKLGSDAGFPPPPVASGADGSAREPLSGKGLGGVLNSLGELGELFA